MNAPLADWTQAALGHRFADPALVDAALTHRSHGGRDYERLEYLGDRVLGCAIADLLYHAFPAEPEGQLTKRSAVLVSRETCAAVARELGVGPYLRLNKQTRADGAAESDNVLGDALEALIGAMLLDGGWPAARAFVARAWAPRLRQLAVPPRHPKSALQEWASARGVGEPAYEIVARSGAHHTPRFRVRVALRGFEAVEAEGSSKQEAETEAARAMLAARA